MSEFADKVRSLGVISRRTRSTVVEGRTHPESGLRFKSVTDSNNNTVTEHSAPGATAVSSRQDVNLRPKIVEQ
jgi:hypothetical protein